MESKYDLIASIIAAIVFAGLIIPLLRYLRYLNKEDKRLTDIHNSKV